MKKILINTPAILTILCLLTACSEKTPENTTNNISPTTTSAPATTTYPTNQWAGQWNGPEGTFLLIVGSNGQYDLTIQNLDGPTSYTGIGIENEIKFERAGIKETIRATNGVETGMKWLSEKSNCLTIRSGEGYCKD